MSAEYIREETVQSSRPYEKISHLLSVIMESDSNTFDTLLNDEPTLLNCSIPPGYNYLNIYQIIVKHSTHTFIDNVFTQYLNMIDNSTEVSKSLVPIARDGTGTGDRPVRSGPGPNFVPAGLPVDRSKPVDRQTGDRSTYLFFRIFLYENIQIFSGSS
jgi:hypothetical protein